MRDENAKAPKNRKQEISPLLGSIIKISSLLVVAALVVLITLIIVKSLNKSDENKNVFENRIEISLNDYKIITEQLDFSNLSEEVYEVVSNYFENDQYENETFYFFFYYKNQLDDLDKEIISAVNNEEIKKDALIFIARLDVDMTDETPEFRNYLYNNDDLIELEIRNTLDSTRYKSFIISYDKLADNSFDILYSKNGQLGVLENLAK